MAFAALNTGVSGVLAFTSAVDVVSDNIANVDTVGYKRTDSQFSNLVVQQQGGSFAPGGVSLNAQALISEEGILTSSTNPTALGIDGQGFFVVDDMPNPTGTTQLAFTRAGDFRPDSSGLLVNTVGQQLLGFPLDNMGNMTSDISDTSQLAPININDFTGTATPTSNVELNGVFPTSFTQVADPGTGNIAANPTANAQLVQTIFVIDSLGNQVELNAGFTRLNTAGQNDVRVEIFAPNAGTLDTTAAPAGNGPNQVLTSGILTFNGDGTLLQYAQDFPVAATSGPPPGTPVQLSVDAFFLSGADTSNISFNFGDSSGNSGLVLSNAPQDVRSSADGAIFGQAVGVEVDIDGVVTAVFDNGVTQSIAQLPLAVFPNPDGLSLSSGPTFNQSAMSGEVSFVLPGGGGSGAIRSGSLESSTVDLATEFSNLIVAQRGFSANARTISTADEILQELTNII